MPKNACPHADQNHCFFVLFSYKGKVRREEAESYHHAIGFAVEEILAGSSTAATIYEVFTPRKPKAVFTVKWEVGGALVRHAKD